MRVRFAGLIASFGVALVALPSALEAQRPYAWVLPVEEEEESSLDHPFSVLLNRSAELALNESQVGRIETVRERLLEENEPLLAVLRDAEVYEPEREEEVRAVETARARFTQNARAAETQVRTILGRDMTEQARLLIGHDSWAYPPQEEAVEAGEAGARQVRVTMLVVENHNFQDATVYIVAGPRRQRLGFVGGLRDETFTIPDSFVAAPTSIRLEVRQIPAYRLPLTDEVVVMPGNMVYLRIPPS